MLTLSVPLALISSGSPYGTLWTLPMTGGCIGYLVGGWRGVFIGMFTAMAIVFVLLVAVCDQP